MSSATYIPLTRLSSSDYFPAPQFSPHAPFTSYFSRRRAVLALIAATSVVTLVLFLKTSNAHEDDFDYDGIPLNPSYHPSYIAIPVPNSLPPSSQPKLRPVRDLPLYCLDRYYALGGTCHDGSGPVPLDIVWTWVNGSDPLFSDARQKAAQSYDHDDPYRPIKSNNPSRMFRDHDELRHSLRSVLANFRPYTRRFRILSSDIDYPAEDLDDSMRSFPDPGPGYWRLGLQPQWLATADNITPDWRDGDIQLSLIHHAHFFEPYNRTIFNSYAIESQFSHLQDVSEVFIYMNDDFYMTSPLSPVTFYTHEYGFVLRIQSDIKVSPDWPDTKRAKGEWRSMGASNWLLSNRFGRRYRPYIQHEAKSLSFAIIQEIALLWPQAIVKTGTHAFRETESGDGDFYLTFMFAHYLVERSREALLWMWVVGRIGGIDDSWGEREAARAWIEVGGAWDGDGNTEVQVESGLRDTLRTDRVRGHLKDGGLVGDHFKTEYHFSSLDGYAYNEYGRRGVGGWPGYDPEQFDSKDKNKRKCTIRRDECFGVTGLTGGSPTASAIFQHIAFNKPHCGDCIIISLVNASGRLGLSAILPHPDRRSPPFDSSSPVDDSPVIPHLPLVANWRDGAFALRDVMKYAPDTNVREWSMRILQRYRYVIGGTPSMFEQLLNLQQVRGMLSAVDLNQDLALLCINDDVTRDDDEISKYFRSWQGRRWSRAATWESDVRH